LSINYEKLLELRNRKVGFNHDIGLNFTRIEEGYAEAELPIEERHLNPLGTVHGGCTFTLMDAVGGSAAISYGYLITTASSHVLFINAARNTKKLRAVAKAIKAGRTLIDIDVEVFDDADEMVAKATFVFFRLGEKIGV